MAAALTHFDTYRQELGKAYPGFGYALWEPSPGEQNRPVEVGDVGFIREGQFHRLFNALLPADHESHQRFGVPENYEPLCPAVTDHINRRILTPNTFHTRGVTVISGGLEVLAETTVGSAEVSFSCTRNHGAVLSLPVTARCEDTLTLGHFRKWIIKHIDSWFAFTEARGLGLETEDIVLVTGCHRTRSWSKVAFNEVQTDARFSLGVEVAGALGASINWRASSFRIQGGVLSQGPSGEDLPENQCIFVRGFRVKRILWIFPRPKGAAEPKPDSREDDREPEEEVVLVPSITENPDPLHVLLEYIANQAKDCHLALVHDSDLEQILGEGDSLETLRPDTVMDYLHTSKPKIGIMTADALSSDDKSPGMDATHMRVAMLSEQLNSFDPMTSVPLLSRFPVNATSREEGAKYDTFSHPSPPSPEERPKRRGGKRIPTPPPPEDEPRYLTVVHPYPLNANLELHADRRTLALWLACCTGKDVLFAMFHKPSSPGMVVIEVDRDFDGFDRLLGLHTWSEFLQKPSKEQLDKVSMVFDCTYNTGRLIEKHGWKRVNIEEHWFNGWTPNNSIIKHPYPKTTHCFVPSEAKTGTPMCRPLPQKFFPVPPPPPPPPVGSAEWLWNLLPGATARPTINLPEAGDPVAPWAGYDALRLVPPTKVKKMSEWVCPQHGLLCSPGICKERARLERDERMRIEREKWEEQRIQREARRAKKKEREERREKEAEAMGIGEPQRPPHFRGSSKRSGTDTETSRDEDSNAPPPPEQENWSIPWEAREGTDTQSVMSSARRVWNSVAGSDDEDDYADGDDGLCNAETNTSSGGSRSSSQPAPPASVISSGRSKGPQVSPHPPTQQSASEARRTTSSASQTPSVAESVWPSESGFSSRPPSVSAAGSDSGRRSGTRPATRSGARSSPSTITSLAASRFPTFIDTHWGDPIAMALVDAAKEDRRDRGGSEAGTGEEGPSGQKASKSSMKREDKTMVQAQAVQANVLEEAALDVQLPPGGPGSSWGDPNEPW